MQLDHTNIVIRERSAGDTLDISLFVIRRNFKSLLLLLALGAIPFALLNYAALGWMLEVDRRDFNEAQYSGFVFRHYLWMTALIAFEAPLATAFITRYLGDYVFQGRPLLRTVIHDVMTRLPALFFVQGVLRFSLFALAIVPFIDADSEVFFAEVLLVFLFLANLLVRAARPYINELVILERNPFTGARQGALTLGTRSSRLHANDASAFMRFVIGCGFAACLAAALMNLIYMTIGILFGDWSFSPIVRHGVIPLSCWLAAGFVAVTRFLNYLNRRIENEGWEVELRVKAEAAKLFGEAAG